MTIPRCIYDSLIRLASFAVPLAVGPRFDTTAPDCLCHARCSRSNVSFQAATYEATLFDRVSTRVPSDRRHELEIIPFPSVDTLELSCPRAFLAILHRVPWPGGFGSAIVRL
jgi:hypothetical protein